MSKPVTKLLFLSAGLLIGAAVGILFAPDEGAGTRDKLSFRLSQTMERLKRLLNRIRDAEQLPSTAKTEGNKIISETRMEAERLLGHMESLMEQIKAQQPRA
jgi:gas vesicle protein